ncbi:MAG: SDR family oxidoreductase, partial [Firmicutes bacterium]|nr:SDR family oxidoreductase [Bacillota bacterium]
MNQSLLSLEDETEKRRVAESSLVGRWGLAQEIAEVAIWVALDSPVFLTGAEVVVDGGHVVKR